MEKLLYPAIFHEAEEGGFWVTFPDFPECMTQGDDFQSAYEMAVEALELAITSLYEEQKELPVPSAPLILEDTSCVMIEVESEWR